MLRVFIPIQKYIKTIRNPVPVPSSECCAFSNSDEININKVLSCKLNGCSVKKAVFSPQIV